MKRLKEITNRGDIGKLYESYPICFLNGKTATDSDDAIEKLTDALRLLQDIGESYSKKAGTTEWTKDNDLDEFFEVVNKEDFNDVKMWLSEVLWKMRYNKRIKD